MAQKAARRATRHIGHRKFPGVARGEASKLFCASQTSCDEHVPMHTGETLTRNELLLQEPGEFSRRTALITQGPALSTRARVVQPCR